MHARVYPYAPALLLLSSLASYAFLSPAYRDTVAALLGALAMASVCALAVRGGSVTPWRRMLPSRVLLLAFAAAATASFALAVVRFGGFAHALRGNGLDATSFIYLALFAACALCTGMLARPMRLGIRGAALAAIVALMVVPYMRSTVEVRPSLNLTLYIHAAAYEYGGQSALLVGQGPAGFVYAWREHRPKDVLSTPLWSEDFPVGSGVLPTLLVELGVIAALALACAYVAAAAEALHAAIQRKPSAVPAYIDAALSLGGPLVALLALCFAEPSPVLVAAAGLLLGASQQDGEGDRPARRVSLVWLYIISAMAAVALYAGLAALLSVYAARSLSAGDFLSARTAGQYAHTMLPSAATARLLSQITRAQAHSAARSSADVAAARMYFASASSYADEAIALDPRDAQAFKLLGVSLAEQYGLEPQPELFERADRALRSARQGAPLDPSIPYFRAQLYILAGRKEEAKAMLAEALQMRPTYREAEDLLRALEGA